jgi:myo-inositol-1-phosphate synthase
MNSVVNGGAHPLLVLVAGAKGAVGSTLAALIASLRRSPERVTPYLTTNGIEDFLAAAVRTRLAGWDTNPTAIDEVLRQQGVVPWSTCKPLLADLKDFFWLDAPDPLQGLARQVERIRRDIRRLGERHPGYRMVLVNLLPAAAAGDFSDCGNFPQLFDRTRPGGFPDMAYAAAAVLTGIPVVNFSPNVLEIPLLLEQASKKDLPIAGRDGKTGQTYLKVVLASAFRARHLRVDGWYSLNILGNADGANLMEPGNATDKIRHKTDLLDRILEYPVGKRYGAPSHKVHIDYYPPRGDAKEAWDVIDFEGIFGLPMSLRLNLQGRDSILAAPMVLDLARWMAVLQMAGRSGAIPELAFYFKQAVGDHPPVTFEDQIFALQRLEDEVSSGLQNFRPVASV